MEIHWKIKFLGVGGGGGGEVHKKPIYRGELPKKRPWTICRFKGGLDQKDEPLKSPARLELKNCFIVLLLWFVLLLYYCFYQFCFFSNTNCIKTSVKVNTWNFYFLFWAWPERLHFCFKKKRRQRFQFWLVLCFKYFSNFFG